MSYKSFEDLTSWKLSCRLARDICQEFRQCKDYSFRDQITRSAVSVPSNIAEGAERGTRNEFLQFLRYAKGSAGELRTQLYLASELGYLSPNEMKTFTNQAKSISRLILGLIRYLNKTVPSKRPNLKPKS